MQTVARVIVSDTGGTLAEQVDRRAHGEMPAWPFARQLAAPAPASASLPRRPCRRAASGRTSIAFNGLGGFTPRRPRVRHHDHGRDAHARAVGQRARQPVVRHRRQRERRRLHLVRERPRYRLTPWHNDPVGDASGEAFYLRDEEDGRFWSPTPLPAGGAGRTRPATASATASSSTPKAGSRRELRTSTSRPTRR